MKTTTILLIISVLLLTVACTIGNHNSKEFLKLSNSAEFDEIKVKRIVIDNRPDYSMAVDTAGVTPKAYGGTTVIEGGQITVYDGSGTKMIEFFPGEEMGVIQTYYKNGQRGIILNLSSLGDAGIWRVDKYGREHYCCR